MFKGELLIVTIQDADGSVFKGTLLKDGKSDLTGSTTAQKSKDVTVSKSTRKTAKPDVRECIRRLIGTGYMDEWRTWQDVHRQLSIKGFGFKKDAVTMCLLRMARDEELERELIEGKNNVYKYKKA